MSGTGGIASELGPVLQSAGGSGDGEENSGREQAMKLGREKRPVPREGRFAFNLNHLFLVL